MIKDEVLIRSYLDNTLKETERYYVKERLVTDKAFKELFERIRMYYDAADEKDLKRKPKISVIPVVPLPKKYMAKLRWMMLLKVIVICAIVWAIMSYFFG